MSSKSGFIEEERIANDKVSDFIEAHKNLGHLGFKIWGIQDDEDNKIVVIYETQEQCNKGQAGR